MTTIKEAASVVGDKVLAAKEAAQEMRRSASQILGQAGTDSEGALHTAASAVRNAGVSGAAIIDGIAESTGRRFASASSFLECPHTGGMIEELRRSVQRHPGAFLILAAAVAGTVGFMAGSSKNSGRD